MRKPQWLDSTIQLQLDSGAGADAIARAVASHSRFLDAVRRGLANKPSPGVMGPSHAQVIADELMEELQKD